MGVEKKEECLNNQLWTDDEATKEDKLWTIGADSMCVCTDKDADHFVASLTGKSDCFAKTDCATKMTGSVATTDTAILGAKFTCGCGDKKKFDALSGQCLDDIDDDKCKAATVGAKANKEKTACECATGEALIDHK